MPKNATASTATTAADAAIARRTFRSLLQIERDALDPALEREGAAHVVDPVRRDRQAVVAADVEARGAREAQRHGVLELALGDLLPVDEEPLRAARRELLRRVGGELVADVQLARGQGLLRDEIVELQPEEAVGV